MMNFTPGPGPTPGPWLQNGSIVYYPDGGVVLPDPTIAGGSKGKGTINASGLFVGGVPVGVAGGSVSQINPGVGIHLIPSPISTVGSVGLADTAVAPGVYGDAADIPQITVDQQGRITHAVSIPVSIPPAGIQAVSSPSGSIDIGGTLANTTLDVSLGYFNARYLQLLGGTLTGALNITPTGLASTVPDILIHPVDTQTPFIELWNNNGVANQHRGRLLMANDGSLRLRLVNDAGTTVFDSYMRQDGVFVAPAFFTAGNVQIGGSLNGVGAAFTGDITGSTLWSQPASGVQPTVNWKASGGTANQQWWRTTETLPDGKLHFQALADDGATVQGEIIFDRNGLIEGAASQVFVGTAPPVTPAVNQLWWNSTLGQMFLWYNDGNTTQWVPTSTGSVGPQGPAGPAGPATPGNVLQVVDGTFNAWNWYQTYTAIASNDTLPTVAMGLQVASITIVPQSAASRLEIDALFNCWYVTADNYALTVFRDGVIVYTGAIWTNGFVQIQAKFRVPSSSTASTTFTFRIGSNSANGFGINGNQTSRMYGGSMRSGPVVREVVS